MKRHKWNGKARKGVAVGCLNCRCVKEIIGGIPSYFMDDTVTTIAPNCDGKKDQRKFDKNTTSFIS